MLEKFDEKKVANFGRTFQINATFLLCNLIINIWNSANLTYKSIYWEQSFILGEELALPINIITATIPFFLIFSLARVMAIFDNPLKESFFNIETQPSTFWERVKFLFKNKYFLIRWGLFVFFTLIFPAYAQYAGIAQIVPLDMVRWVVIICFTPLIVLGYTTAIKVWIWHKPMEEFQKRKKKYKKGGLFKETMLVCVAYIVGGLGLMMLLPVLRTIMIAFSRAFTLKFLILIVIALFIPFFTRYIRAYSKRRKFLKRLYKICEERNYTLSKINFRYRSATGIYKGESFSVYIGDRRFSCKLIGCPKKYMPLFIFPGGCGAFLKIVRFLRVELKRSQINFNFGYEAEGKKVLIINPTPKFVYTAFMDKVIEVENADIIGGYEIYTATAFLNALERDCIDID